MRGLRSPTAAPAAPLPKVSPAVAVAAAALVWLGGLLVRAALAEVLGAHAAFLWFVPAVVVGAALGGLWPGLIATVLGLVAGLWLTGPSRAGLIDAAVFVGVGASVTLGGEWFQRAHRDLAAREAHLRSVLDTMPDAMILIDEAGLIHSFSPAAERLFGWRADEVAGRNVSLLTPPAPGEAADGQLERIRRAAGPAGVGLGPAATGERKDGSTFPMELAVGEMPTAGGRFFTVFVRDLTERQRAEARLQALQGDLVRVSRLTALGEMASALAHELNQPLTAIANYLKGSRRLLAAPAPPVERVAEAVDRAASQALRAGEIIRRLRDFVAHGETERRIEDLRMLIDEASALALVGAREHGVRVRFDLDASVERVLANRVQVQQVLLNLIRNAVDAMDAAPPRELTIAVAAQDEDMARITVADTGPGIDPEVADQLFQPFVTTKRTGMGVGLSISRTIVEAHGGRIWFEPRPGGGALFHFTLQRADLAKEQTDDD